MIKLANPKPFLHVILLVNIIAGARQEKVESVLLPCLRAKVAEGIYLNDLDHSVVQLAH